MDKLMRGNTEKFLKMLHEDIQLEEASKLNKMSLKYKDVGNRIARLAVNWYKSEVVKLRCDGC